MKKIAFIVAIAIGGCTNGVQNQQNGTEEVKTVQQETPKAEETKAPVDEAQQAMTESMAPNEQWTETAVEKRVREIYEEVNKYSKVETPAQELHEKYATEYFIETYKKMWEINAKHDQETGGVFFNRDYYWDNGMPMPLKVKDVKVELLTGNMAEAQFKVESEDGVMTTDVKWSMDWERGEWRISDWKGLGEGEESLMASMEKYIEEYGK